MPRRPHTSPHTRAVLSALLSSYPAQTYGYDLSKATDLKSGTLYPILQRLHEQGYLEADWEPSPHEGKPPRQPQPLLRQAVDVARERREEERGVLRGALL